MGKKRRRTSNQRDDTWTKGPEKPADAARRLRCAQRFEAYYRQQLGLEDDEWRRMMATFRKPLPATFRVTAPDGLAAKIERILANRTATKEAPIYYSEKNEHFFQSAPTALSPRSARYDNRVKFKFVDFEEL